MLKEYSWWFSIFLLLSTNPFDCWTKTNSELCVLTVTYSTCSTVVLCISSLEDLLKYYSKCMQFYPSASPLLHCSLYQNHCEYRANSSHSAIMPLISMSIQCKTYKLSVTYFKCLSHNTSLPLMNWTKGKRARDQSVFGDFRISLSH